MNEHRGSATRRRPWPVRCRAVIVLTPAALLAACSNPLMPEEGDYGPRTPVERLRTVATLRLEDRALPAEPAAVPDEPPSDPFAGLERFELNIEQARAWTLSNNLDLQVALVEPTIARENLSEEEARFESVFFIRNRWNNFDQPTTSTIENNQGEAVTFTPGVRIPLRTGGTATIELPSEYNRTNAQFSTPEVYENDVRLSISQPLLRNAGRRASTYTIRLQALETQIAEARAKLEVIRQLAAVDRAYWRLYTARKLLEVRQDQYQLAKRQLEQAERRVRAQVAPEVEVVRAQSGLAERLEAIINAENSVRDLQRDLKRIMNQNGLDISSSVLIELTSEPDPVQFDLDPRTFSEAAIANRMEMLELELRLAQDYSTIEFQKNQALPLFTLDYAYSFNGTGTTLDNSLSTLRSVDFQDWSFGANFEVPLGNEAGEARIHQAILRRLQRLSSKDARELAIRQEVYNAVDQIDAAWQRILASRQSAILAARTLRAEENQFEVGARTSTDVLDAATRLADAQSAEIRALADYQISQVDLAFATGTLLGAAKVDWAPRDPRGSSDFVGERRGRVPLGPAGILPKGAAADPSRSQAAPDSADPPAPEQEPAETAPAAPTSTEPAATEPAPDQP